MNENFNLINYMNNGVRSIVENALKASLKNPRESAFLLKYLKASKKAEKQRMKQERLGSHIPPFLIASISTKCNLFCKGCYARANESCHEKDSEEQLTVNDWNRLFRESEDLGVSFILLAGGEPLMRKDVIRCAGEIPNIIFPIFTNGTMVDSEYLDLFHQKRNLVPILSLEGSATETDQRRGEGVFQQIESTMEQMKNLGLLFGASITVTTENIHTVTEETFLRSLSLAGCKIVFFVEYVPVAPETENLAPTQTEREIMDQRLAALRSQDGGMVLLSFPGDEQYSGGCLAAGRGFFHINADGGAEPCPFSPFSDINVRGHSLLEVLNSKLFRNLHNSGLLNMEHNGGCALFQKESEIREMIS